MNLALTIEPLAGARLHKGPAGAGEEAGAAVRFEAGKDEIVFGREPTSDVVFAPQDRIVSRKHFRLYRQASGHYAIEVFGDRYVERNGVPAASGEAVADGDVIRLGGKNGPSLRIGLKEEASASGLERTLTQVRVATTGQQFRRIRHVVAGLTAVVIVAGIGGYVFLDRQSGRLDALQTYQQEVERRLAGDFDREIVDRFRRSAYAVVLEGRDGSRTLLGTAWPVGEGWLATNAHVARQFDPRGVRKVLAIRSGGGEVHSATEAWIHPGYGALKDFRAGEGRADADFAAAFEGLPQPSGFDIALLKVDRPEALEPALLLASPEEIAALGPGDALAYAGYPVEGTTAEKSAAENPEPSVKFGYASSVTDFFLFATDPARAFLIRHSIPATGGASGSPIFNRNGRVVAVLSGGTVFDAGGERQPSAVLENFAQRIDLLDAWADPARPFDVEASLAYWRNEVLPRFGRHRQQIVGDAVAALEKAVPGEQAVETMTLRSSLGDRSAVSAGPVAYVEHDVAVENGRRYTFLVYGEIGRTVSLRLFRGDEAVGFAGSGTSFAAIDFAAEASETLKLRVLGEKDNPIDYQLFVFTTERTSTAAAPAE